MLKCTTTPADTSRVRYQSRPGVDAVVATSLADLKAYRGHRRAAHQLFWYPDRTFDLGEPGMLPWMYQVVLREASSTEDLAYLNGDMLIALVKPAPSQGRAPSMGGPAPGASVGIGPDP